MHRLVEVLRYLLWIFLIRCHHHSHFCLSILIFDVMPICIQRYGGGFTPPPSPSLQYPSAHFSLYFHLLTRCGWGGGCSHFGQKRKQNEAQSESPSVKVPSKWTIVKSRPCPVTDMTKSGHLNFLILSWEPRSREGYQAHLQTRGSRV